MTFWETMRRGTKTIANKAVTAVKSEETKKNVTGSLNFLKEIGTNAYNNDFGSPFGKGGFSSTQPNINFIPKPETSSLTGPARALPPKKQIVTAFKNKESHEKSEAHVININFH